MTKDIEIIVDDSKETFLEKDQQCDSVKAAEIDTKIPAI